MDMTVTMSENAKFIFRTNYHVWGQKLKTLLPWRPTDAGFTSWSLNKIQTCLRAINCPIKFMQQRKYFLFIYLKLNKFRVNTLLILFSVA